MMASGQLLRAAGAAPYQWSLDGDPGAAAGAPRAGAAEWAAARAAVARAAGGLHVVPDVPLDPAPAVVRLAPLIAGVLADLEAGAAPGAVGARLHVTLAALVLDLCRRVRAASGLCRRGALRRRVPEPAARRRCSEQRSAADGFQVLGAGLVPVNDGGVSLGQAAVAGYTVLERRGELA